MSQITIAGRRVGPGSPCLAVAELSANHRQDYARAVELVYAAKEAGAEVVKVQMFTADEMCCSGDHPSLRLTWAGRERTLHDLYAETAMPLDWHPRLKELADSLELLYVPSVFSEQAIRLAIEIGCPALKIASFEITYLSLIRACWTTGLPLILSTGMATREEIEAPLDTIIDDYRRAIFLRCTSAYPAGVQDARLRWIGDNYNWLTVGLSDHSRSNAVVSAAVTLGACLVERHFTLDRSAGGPDAAFSDEPAEFAAMVRCIRETEAALGTVHYGPTESELPMLRYRRSVWVVQDIPAGGKLTPENVRCLRPADGLPPSKWDTVIGRTAAVEIKRGTPLSWEVIGC